MKKQNLFLRKSFIRFAVFFVVSFLLLGFSRSAFAFGGTDFNASNLTSNFPSSVAKLTTNSFGYGFVSDDTTSSCSSVSGDIYTQSRNTILTLDGVPAPYNLQTSISLCQPSWPDYGSFSTNYSAFHAMLYSAFPAADLTAGHTVRISISGISNTPNEEWWMQIDLNGGYVSPNCFDGIQNQDETGIDRGGVCVFYTKIKNTSSGSINLMDGASTSANVIKTLPEDWIVQITASRDSSGAPVSANGYYWYQVTDPTDGVSGWMKGSNDTETTYYLPFNTADQVSFEATAISQYSTASTRAVKILEAVNHYYNDTSTTNSIYSSDNLPTNYKISQLKNGGYPEKLIWGIAAREDGGSTFNFDNENVTSDYGHGIMQITFSPSYPFDNRGGASKVIIPPCSLALNLYTNCYTDVDSTSPYLRHYQPYGGNSNNPTYKEYSNTEQSIYANIKDGLYILAHNYSVFDGISTSVTVNEVTYSADDRKDILTTQYYNGGNDDACNYVDLVADKLDNIGTYFSGETASDISDLISKMHSAGTDVICADLHSPGDLSIQDTKGRTVGVVNGKGVNDFPLAVYDKDRKFVDILAAGTNNYKYKITGTSKGTYGLNITIKNGNRFTTFKAKDISILPGEVHTYLVDKNALIKGQNGVTLTVDRKGNGKVNRIIKTGMTLSGSTYNLGATSKELEAFKNR